ncbi:MAG TPA: GNAT family N-acetyltransferase [Pyrinomonadaceae bacterium]|nr:GNAT family N-acetyltransferase [Pyrinomonadaceae bacterium]
MSDQFEIEPLATRHDRRSFDCGEPSLNDFLQRFARQNDDKGLGRTFVAVRPGEAVVMGYYMMASGAVTFDTIPEKPPRYPIPVAHIGRLAVDLRARGLGLGELLLIDALCRTTLIAESIGIYVVEVRALNETARAFYLKYGFVALLDDPLHLYLPMKTVRQLKLLEI